MKIGILALQGNFKQHEDRIKSEGHIPVKIRYSEDLKGIDGLIFPGGESTVLTTLLNNDSELKTSLVKAIQHIPIWGTCAGLILLSNKFENGDQPILGGLNIITKRNEFGSQVNSFESQIIVNGKLTKNQFCFIRAPSIISCGEEVKPLAFLPNSNNPVAVRHNNILATTFHPEVGSDTYWINYFINNMCSDKNNLESPIFTTVEKISKTGTEILKLNFMEMLVGGVIMDVTNSEQARIAEEAGAVSVMALEKIPSDIRKDGGVSRMSDPAFIKQIMDSTTVPVMAKSRIGHFSEAKIIQALQLDTIDESEVLTPADPKGHIIKFGPDIEKQGFKIPFVCGAKNLGEALRRINEGACMIRSKGEAGTGNVMHAVKHIKEIYGEIEKLKNASHFAKRKWSKTNKVPHSLLQKTISLGRLPVITFAAGGLATPADVALLMELGVDGVFVGSAIFKSDNPKKRAKAIVLAARYWDNAYKMAQISENLGGAMTGLGTDELDIFMSERNQ